MMKKILLYLGLVFLLISIAFANTEDNITIYYSFDTDNLSDPTIYNVANSSIYNAACVNMTNCNRISGILEQATQFVDANATYVNGTTYSYLQRDNPFSIALWFNSTTLSTGDNDVIFMHTLDPSGADDTRVNIWLRDGKIRSNIYNGSTFIYSGQDDFKGGRFYHVVVTWDGTDNLSMFVNATIATDSFTSAVNGQTEGFFVGALNDAGITKHFNGTIDDLAVWERVIPQSDIDYLYNNHDANKAIADPDVNDNRLITETFNSTATETVNETIYILFQNYSASNNSTATLTYNDTVYSGVISHSNSSYVLFYVDNVSIPMVSANNTGLQFFWNYTLYYLNGSSLQNVTTNNTQYAYYGFYIHTITLADQLEAINYTSFVNVTDQGGADLKLIYYYNYTLRSAINTTNGFNVSFYTPFVVTNQSIIYANATLNVTYRGQNFLRSYSPNPFNHSVSYGYYINSITLPNTFENATYTSVVSVVNQSLGSFTLIYYYNNTLRTATSTTSGFNVTFNLPIVYLNNTQITGNATLNISYAGQNYLRAFTSNPTSHYLYWNLTKLPRVNVTAYDLINATNITIFSLNDSYIDLSTTGGFIYFYSVPGANNNYSITFSASGYQNRTYGLNFTADTLNSYQFLIYTSNSFNFSFYNEVTGVLITDNITIEFISDAASYNYTAADGTLYVDLLTPSTYTIRYNSSGWGRLRQYIYLLNDSSHQEIDLYLINDANGTETTITVYDQLTLTSIEGAVIYLQRYDVTTNSYFTVAMYSTDVAGVAYFDVQQDDELYKFLVDYPFRTRKLETNGLYISETSVNLYVSTTETIGEVFFDEQSITYTVSYDNDTETFTATWTDASNVATRFCLYLKDYNDYYTTTLNSSCSTASSGSIDLTGINSNTTNYAIFKATIDGEEKVLATAWTDYYEDLLSASQYGLFLSSLVIFCLALFSPYPAVAMIFSSIALVFTKLFGILQLDWITVIIICIGAALLSLFMELKKR